MENNSTGKWSRRLAVRCANSTIVGEVGRGGREDERADARAVEYLVPYRHVRMMFCDEQEQRQFFIMSWLLLDDLTLGLKHKSRDLHHN